MCVHRNGCQRMPPPLRSSGSLRLPRYKAKVLGCQRSVFIPTHSATGLVGFVAPRFPRGCAQGRRSSHRQRRCRADHWSCSSRRARLGQPSILTNRCACSVCAERRLRIILSVYRRLAMRALMRSSRRSSHSLGPIMSGSPTYSCTLRRPSITVMAITHAFQLLWSDIHEPAEHRIAGSVFSRCIQARRRAQRLDSKAGLCCWTRN